MRGEDTLPQAHSRNISTTTAREDFRRHARRKSSSGLNNLQFPSDDRPSRLPSFLPSRVPNTLRNMHPPSFRQLLVASTVLIFFLFLYGRRLWSSHNTDIHDEWAKPQVPIQAPPPAPQQPPAQQPAGSGKEDSKTQNQPPLQQVPWHWNTYPS